MQESDLYYFDEKASLRPVNFVERYCTHVKGELMGEPIELTPYHKEMITNVWGWRRKEDGKRKHKLVYQEIPKKNAKSIILAALGLYITGYDGEKGAEVVVVATDKDQARIIHNTAKQMIEQNESLSKHFDIYTDAIHHRRTHSVFKVLSGDVRGKHGPDLYCVIFDELHEQKHGDLWDTLTKGVAARSDFWIWGLTTAGYKGTFAHELSKAAYRAHMGLDTSPYWYTQFYGIRDEQRALKNYHKESIWKEANPGYGITVHKPYFEFQMDEIKKLPSKLTGFLRLHLNVWTGTEVSWSILPYWADCDIKPVVAEELAGRKCFGGLDLALREDTNALVWLFPPVGDEKHYTALVRCWIPLETLHRRVKEEHVNFEVWVRQGVVNAVEGNTIDNEVIIEQIKKDAKLFDVQLLLSDPYNATEAILALQKDGIEADFVAQRAQHTTPALKKWEGLIRSKKFNHGDNPLYNWQASNAMTVTLEHENYFLSKKKSTGRIDALSATVNAFAATTHEKKKKVWSASDILGKRANKNTRVRS